MHRKIVLAAVGLAAAVSLTSTAFAGAADYTFEPVKTEVKKGSGVTVAVRLVHKPTGKPVSPTRALTLADRRDSPRQLNKLKSATKGEATQPAPVAARLFLPNHKRRRPGAGATQ